MARVRASSRDHSRAQAMNPTATTAVDPARQPGLEKPASLFPIFRVAENDRPVPVDQLRAGVFVAVEGAVDQFLISQVKQPGAALSLSKLMT